MISCLWLTKKYRFAVIFVLIVLLFIFSPIRSLAQTVTQPVNNYLYLNGNVGIGTASPVNKLHVIGNGEVGKVKIVDNNNTDIGNVGPSVQSNGAALYLESSDSDWVSIGYYHGNGVLLGRGGRGMAVRSDGSVGIGTHSPGAPLHVVGAELRLDTAGGNPPFYSFYNAGARLGFMQANNSDGNFYLVSEQNGSMLFMTSSGGSAGEKMRITGDGKVGIGTASPGEKLDVSGNAKISGNLEVAGQIKGRVVDSGVLSAPPDYVFESNYPLKTLQYVEEYVKRNKHLEGIPEGADTKSWAKLSLQERDMKLLEKIEELTLYVINQQKEIDALKEQLRK